MVNENPIAAPVEELEQVDQDNRLWSAFYLTIYALLIALTISVVALGLIKGLA